MKTKLAAMIVMLGAAIGASAQLTTITASNLNLGGVPISGTGCFQATGVPGAGYLIGSLGQSSGRPVCRDVVSGAILTTLKGVTIGALQLADVTLSSPQNLCYNFTVRDSGGTYLIGTPGGQYSGYACVQPSGATFSMDTFVPTEPSLQLGYSIEYLTVDHLTVSGDCSGPGCGSNGGSIVLETNGTHNSSQSTLNIQNGVGTTASNPSGAIVQVNVTYGAAAGTAAQGNDARITGAEQTANKGAASGYAPLDSSSLVPLANIPALPESKITNLISDLAATLNQSYNPDWNASSGPQLILNKPTIPAGPPYTESQITNLISDLAGKQASLGFTPENVANKGAASGYAPLDASSKLPHANLPALVSADIVNNAANTSGNAGSATAAQTAGSECSTGYAPRGVDINWNAKDCQSLAASGMSNPMTSPGDTIYGGVAGAPSRLPGNTAATDQVYVSHGTGSAAQAPTLTNAPALSAANMTVFPSFPESQITGLVSDLAGKQSSLGFTPENVANKGAASGYAPLDGSSLVPLVNVPALPESKITNLTSDLAGKQASLGFTPENAANKGAASGYAPLDASSLVPLVNVPALPESKITNLTSDLAGKQASLGFTPENVANKGAASGYAPLDASSKLPHANLPALVSADIVNNAANTSGNAGSATTAGELNGGAVPAPATAAGTNASGQLIDNSGVFSGFTRWQSNYLGDQIAAADSGSTIHAVGVVIADSTGAGSNATSAPMATEIVTWVQKIANTGPTPKLAELIQARFGLDDTTTSSTPGYGGDGWIPSFAQIVSGGQAVPYNSTLNVTGASHLAQSAHDGATTFCPDDTLSEDDTVSEQVCWSNSSTTHMTGYALAQSGGGNYQCNIDGGSFGTSTSTSGSTSLISTNCDFSGLTEGSHTVCMKVASLNAGKGVGFCGVRTQDTTQTATFEIEKWASGGQELRYWNAIPNAVLSAPSIDPAFVAIETGPNEFHNGDRTPAQVAADLTAAKAKVNTVWPNASVIYIKPQADYRSAGGAYTFAQYEAAIESEAIADGVTLVDFYRPTSNGTQLANWGFCPYSAGTSGACTNSNSVHLNDQGNAWVAAAAYPTITNEEWIPPTKQINSVGATAPMAVTGGPNPVVSTKNSAGNPVTNVVDDVYNSQTTVNLTGLGTGCASTVTVKTPLANAQYLCTFALAQTVADASCGTHGAVGLSVNWTDAASSQVLSSISNNVGWRLAQASAWTTAANTNETAASTLSASTVYGAVNTLAPYVKGGTSLTYCPNVVTASTCTTGGTFVYTVTCDQQ